MTWVQASRASRLGTASFHSESCTVSGFILSIVFALLL